MSNVIKAIETSYKGFSFRSRLEARWAVFFDAMGVQWEYEKEGYDLGEAGWYLPDFWLPETKSFIEVKPKPVSPCVSQNLYLAGKFIGGTGKNTPHDWREDFIDLKRYSYSSADDLPTNEFFGTYCGFLYAGPFPVDLMSGHAGRDIGHYEGGGAFSHYGNDDVKYESRGGKSSVVRWNEERNTVMQKCFSAIDAADVVFAWIDTSDCYGTLVELGYAKAKGKKVIVGICNSLPDAGEMWFSQAIADVCVSAQSPKDAFDYVFPLSDEESKAQALSYMLERERVSGKSPYGNYRQVGIVYGDPVDHCVSVFTAYNFNRYCHNSLLRGGKPIIGSFFAAYSQSAFDKSALAARSARFEHGQSGAK